jgi:hypothetical protein
VSAIGAHCPESERACQEGDVDGVTGTLAWRREPEEIVSANLQTHILSDARHVGGISLRKSGNEAEKRPSLGGDQASARKCTLKSRRFPSACDHCAFA